MPWFEWSQSDIPCVFASERAEENRRFLEGAFSSAGALVHPRVRNGHLQRLWHSVGADAFLQLNWLAEDMRLLESKSGYREVLRDLSDLRLCEPTWHAVHTAALFERARRDSVVELINARNAEAPDLIVRIDDVQVPVEAKLLMQSEAEEAFMQRAKELVRSLRTPTCAFPQDTLTVIVPKRPPSAADVELMLDFCRTNLALYTGKAIQCRSRLCNLFVEPTPPALGVSDCHGVWVMTPVPESEGLRVLERAKKASRQLRAFPTGRNSGIMAVGLSDFHVGEQIFGHIGTRILAGRLSGIGAVLLTRRRTLLGPSVRSTVDILAVKTNDRAAHPIAGPILLRPLAHAVRMTEAEQNSAGMYSWRYGDVSGTKVGPVVDMRLPDLRVLDPSMLV